MPRRESGTQPAGKADDKPLKILPIVGWPFPLDIRSLVNH